MLSAHSLVCASWGGCCRAASTLEAACQPCTTLDLLWLRCCCTWWPCQASHAQSLLQLRPAAGCKEPARPQTITEVLCIVTSLKQPPAMSASAISGSVISGADLSSGHQQQQTATVSGNAATSCQEWRPDQICCHREPLALPAVSFQNNNRTTKAINVEAVAADYGAQQLRASAARP